MSGMDMRGSEGASGFEGETGAGAAVAVFATVRSAEDGEPARDERLRADDAGAAEAEAAIGPGEG